MWWFVSLIAEKVEAKPAYPQHGRHKESLQDLMRISSVYSARSTSWIVSCSEFSGFVCPGACCGSRQLSRIPTWCTHCKVQVGAHHFSVLYSRSKSAIEYCSSGIPG